MPGGPRVCLLFSSRLVEMRMIVYVVSDVSEYFQLIRYDRSSERMIRDATNLNAEHLVRQQNQKNPQSYRSYLSSPNDEQLASKK